MDRFFEKMRHTFCELEEAPVLSKGVAVGKFLWSILLFLFLIIFPVSYLYVFAFLWSEGKHSFFITLLLTPVYNISLWWKELIHTSFFECKRAFGFHKKPVYRWVRKKDGKAVALSALELLRELKRKK